LARSSPASPELRTSLAAAEVEFATPPSTDSEYLDAFHDGEELRYRRLEYVYKDQSVPGLADRATGDPELMLMSSEEPANFAIAERDAEWRKAMLEEMCSIEVNNTW